jgi:hypothetical protein
MIVPYYKAIEDKRFTPERAEFIATIAKIVERAFAEVGPVTVRQVYYRAVNDGVVESGQKAYKSILGAIRDGRVTGRIAWNVIEDRTREPLLPGYNTSIRAALDQLAASFRFDANAGQQFRIEVWLEQAALEAIVWPVCAKLGVPLVTCGGFTSHDSLFRGSERQIHYAGLDQRQIVFVLSDLDPSGVSMPKYIRKMLTELSGEDVHVQRLGLTPQQAEAHGLLGRALKVGRADKKDDPRAAAYTEEYGELAYELDGLPAHVLQQLVEDAITPLIDWSARARVDEQSLAARAKIRELIRLGEQEELI